MLTVQTAIALIRVISIISLTTNDVIRGRWTVLKE